MTAGAAESVGAAAVARRYFSAIARRDLSAGNTALALLARRSSGR